MLTPPGMQRRCGALSCTCSANFRDAQRSCTDGVNGRYEACINLQELLEACGRSHSLADVHMALAAVREAAPAAWSLDLMAGLPRLGAEHWQASLAQAVAAQPDHISVYDLQACFACTFRKKTGCVETYG